MNSSRKIVFFGTPEQSGLILSSLIENGHEIVGVITAKDKRRSRGKTLYPTPVKRIALELGLNVYESELKSEIEEIVDKLVAEKEAEVGFWSNPDKKSIRFIQIWMYKCSLFTVTSLARRGSCRTSYIIG